MVIRLKCKRCEWEWNYKGKKVITTYPQYTSCPRCYALVKIRTLEMFDITKKDSDGKI